MILYDVLLDLLRQYRRHADIAGKEVQMVDRGLWACDPDDVSMRFRCKRGQHVRAIARVTIAAGRL
jgi:hypothetical protein